MAENIEKRNYDILSRPYLKQKDIAIVCNASPSSISNYLKKTKLRMYPWGYSRFDVMKEFRLESYYHALDLKYSKSGEE